MTMSYQNGWATINLEMTDHVPRTEYSAHRHWELIRTVTGIAADGKDHNGMSSFQMVADLLELEGAPKQPKTGLIYNENVRKDFDALKAIIKSGGK